MARKTKKELYLTGRQSQFLAQQAKKTNDELINDFNSSYEGLNDKKVEDLQEKYGFNVVSKKSKVTWWKTLLSSYFTIFSVILLIIASINLILNLVQPDKEDWVGFSIIMVMFFFAGTLKFVQDFKSSKAAQRLDSMIRTTANLKRNNVRSEIAISEIVPGDIIYLAAGDMVPADMRLLYAKDLFITQSALTGESEPVEKVAKILENEQTNMLYCNNICYMGTTVASGSAYGIAIQTGKSTFFGKIANILASKKPKTSFDKGIGKVSLIITSTMIFMVLIIFILHGCWHTINVDTNKWLTALTYSLSVAIGVVPEMLPMIVTLNLSKEAIKLSKQKAIIKNINCIQTFGAMDVLCTDKTGTLTEDHIVLQEHLNVNGKEDEQVLFYGSLNSYFQTGLKNLIDKAVIEKAMTKDFFKDLKKFTKVDEIPFDFERRRMSIILLNTETNKRILVTKGASEETLRICKYIKDGDEIKELTNDRLLEIKSKISQLNDNGMRVIAVSINKNEITADQQFSVNDEKEMILVGYIALLDPPKLSAKKAITSLTNKGVQVKILTGDNEKVAKYICKELNLDYQHVLLGDDIENMSFDQLKEKAKTATIFAKLAPEQKALVVRALKANKHIVGFMGDGINDAPAMKAADIAISVDTAVDIAKESADIILLEKDLDILSNGVVQGRKTFANIMKYIKITLSSNFGNMLSVLIATFWLPFLPMQSIQILFLNLCFDLTQLSIPWDNVDEQFLRSPKNWDAKSIFKFMLCLGPISSIFDIVTFVVMFYILGYNDGNNPSDVACFNTGWFLESMLSQIVIVFVFRTKKISFISDRPCNALLIIFAVMFTICMAAPYIHYINQGLKFGIINHMFYLHLLWIICSYVLVGEIGKRIYIHQSKGMWL